jgi:hypothetical protein
LKTTKVTAALSVTPAGAGWFFCDRYRMENWKVCELPEFHIDGSNLKKGRTKSAPTRLKLALF